MDFESFKSQAVPALTSDEVHVWTASLDSAGTLDQSQVLTEDELELANGLQFDDVRRRFVASRVALRLVLSRYLDVPPQELQFAYGTHGKPRLKVRGRVSFATGKYCHLVEPLVAKETRSLRSHQFNLAHSGDLALIAVALNCEIGVDIEQIRPVHHLEQLARRYFHPAEATAVCATDVTCRAIAFLRCWTRKEAVLKAIGSGIQYPLDAFQVSMEEADGSWVDLPAHADFTGGRCWVASVEPSRNYIAAVACVGSQRRVRLLHLA